jgi:hypothetical protein
VLCLVELRGFEPLTPCMPSMRGRFTKPYGTSHPSTTAQRRLVPVAEAFDSIWIEDGFGPLYRRIFLQAALPVGP